jgi:hypothetical protein
VEFKESETYKIESVGFNFKGAKIKGTIGSRRERERDVKQRERKWRTCVREKIK